MDIDECNTPVSADDNNFMALHEKKWQRMASSPTSPGTPHADTPYNIPLELSDILLSIKQKLSAMDSRVDLIEVLNKEFQAWNSVKDS